MADEIYSYTHPTDTAAGWALGNRVLALGEVGYDSTNNELRAGNGIDLWASLTPIAGDASGTVDQTARDLAQQALSAAGAKYAKPSTGIPQSDLDSATSGKINAAGAAYQKPGTGIPDTDLASTFIKTVNGNQPDTSGNIVVSGGGSGGAVSSVAGKTGDVTLNKSDVGLSNVTNTSDANKPVSTAQATAIGAKYTKPSDGIPKTDLASDVQTSLGKADTALQSAPVASVAGKTGSVSLAKGDVGLGNVDNTSDASKPVSTAQAVAIAAKGTAVDVRAFGAVGDGVTNDTASLNVAIAAGVPLYWGGSDRTYKITAALATTLNAPLVWHADGAQVVVGSSSSIQRAVNIDTNGYSVTINGPLVLDCARLAFTGWYFRTASTTRANFTARQLSVRNVYRASTALTGGDGLWISGGYENVYLERPDVRSITMAAGAGVSGAQGVAGITIRAEGAGLAPGEITIVHPYISGVYSEDSTYLMDQDGIRIFTEEDNGSVTLFDTHFTILGGTIKNCHGRSVKSQVEFGSIIGTKILRDTSVPQMQGQGQMPEIDFQVGGGSVQNVELRYQSASAPTIIQASGTRQSGGKYSTSLQVSGLKGSISGGSNAIVTSLAKINMYEQVKMSVDISDIELVNLGYYLVGNLVELNPTYTTSELILRLSNLTAPMNTGQYVFYRGGPVSTPVFLSVFNVANARPQSTGAISGSATSGNLTVVASGQQIRVS